MAHVEWSAGIDSVSGALSKPGKGSQHSCEKMLLGTHRVAPTENNKCNRLYLRKKVKRTTPITADEAAARLRFTSPRSQRTKQPSWIKRTLQAVRRPSRLTTGRSAATSTTASKANG